MDEEKFEEQFQEALEKLKEGAAEGEKSPTCVTHDDCKIILEGFSRVCQQRNMAQEAIKVLESTQMPSESAFLAAALDKAMNTIEKLARGNRR